MDKKKIILFDFDGVIVDSFEAAYSINAEMKFNLSKEQYKDLFMGNIYDSIKEFVTDENREAHGKKWFKHYNALLMKMPPIKEMPETLAKLAEDFILVVISSSVQSSIHAYLELHDLHHHFDIVMGADVHESKSHKIEMIFDKYNVTKNDCMFITDTVGDLIEAKNKEVESIVVTWGFHEKERFKNHPPFAFAETSPEILEKANQYFA